MKSRMPVEHAVLITNSIIYTGIFKYSFNSCDYNLKNVHNNSNRTFNWAEACDGLSIVEKLRCNGHIFYLAEASDEFSTVWTQARWPFFTQYGSNSLWYATVGSLAAPDHTLLLVGIWVWYVRRLVDWKLFREITRILWAGMCEVWQVEQNWHTTWFRNNRPARSECSCPVF